MASLQVLNVIKKFGDVEVLKGIDIDAEDGEFLVLVGPSGCGKSTLLNMIAGLDSITGGEVMIDGKVVNAVHPKDRDIAMVFQSYALYPNMTVEKNMAFGMEMRKIPKPERDKAVMKVAKLLQIEGLLKRKPGQLSGGQRQRVAMGRALVRDPKIFLFDEPLSNLDAKLRVEMRTEIKKLHRRLGTTIVYVTHDQIEAMTLATRIAVMKDGILQQFATPQEIYDRPSNVFVAGFMGSPPMNLIPAKIAKDGDGLSVEIATADERTLRLKLNGTGKGLSAHVGSDVLLGLRPEAITDLESSDSGGDIQEVECSVEVTEPTGPDMLAVLLLGGIEVVSRMRSSANVHMGEMTKFAINMSKAVFFDTETEERI
ncbi:MAG: sn-glycerol-3-phosphate ABC transporter ATP-binding protein UgpC [Rhodospirillales bacterium]|jgi:multiple sugar transport system ATP-binding protein|nr:sn-glycerol-3-phosphate ABC transporter ATP-binding protein UgpC [Rhodospirillales bacterium]